MKKSIPPSTISVQELAEFWDTHSLADFEEQLEEVTEPVFVRDAGVKVPLDERQTKAVEKMAKAKGVSREELIRGWIVQKLARRGNGAKKRRMPTK